MTNGDLAGVLSVFTADALVVAPLSITLGVEEFHRKFFAEVRQSRTRVLKIFSTVDDLSAVALQFSHSWLPADGRSIFVLKNRGRLRMGESRMCDACSRIEIGWRDAAGHPDFMADGPVIRHGPVVFQRYACKVCATS